MTQHKSVTRKVIAILAAFAIVFALAIPAIGVPAVATDGVVPAVVDSQKSVFLVAYVYPDPDDHDSLAACYAASLGSCFVINEKTLITAYHVIHEEVDPYWQAGLKALDPLYKNKMEIRVYYNSGAFYIAREIDRFKNVELDYTALELDIPLGGSLQLPFADPEKELIKTEKLYSVGYPYESTFWVSSGEDAFSSRDVAIRSGDFVKYTTGATGFTQMEHSATTEEGMSGGPVLNSNGSIVGVVQGAVDAHYYALPTKEIIHSLDVCGIEYKLDTDPVTTATETTTGPTEPPESTEAVNTESLYQKIADAKAALKNKTEKCPEDAVSAFNDAIETAQKVYDKTDASQSEVDMAVTALDNAIKAFNSENNNTKKSDGPDLKLIIIIAAVAALIIAAIIVLLIVLKKKKGDNGQAGPAPAPIPQTTQPPMPPQAGGFNPAGPAPAPKFTPAAPAGSAATGVLNSGSKETSVLNDGGSATTVLTASKPYATLVRKKNGEKIEVSSAKFVMGKDKSQVSYCITGNDTVSRAHARIINKDGQVMIVDLGSTNGTFVNNVKCDPNREVPLKSGDKLTLSDEEFTVTVL